ncbi:hypothetical protein ES703_25022 [subsurface metagenome]
MGFSSIKSLIPSFESLNAVNIIHKERPILKNGSKNWILKKRAKMKLIITTIALRESWNKFSPRILSDKLLRFFPCHIKILEKAKLIMNEIINS